MDISKAFTYTRISNLYQHVQYYDLFTTLLVLILCDRNNNNQSSFD